jgi:serine/threonine-protein kinase
MSRAEPERVPEGLPKPGELLAGKYRVERVVGVGGMGVVLAATHVQLEERVALKLMKREVMNAETIGRFLREARSAAKIKSEHVARVMDVGILDDGTPFMEMELLEGEDLGQRVQERGPLPPLEAADYVLQACEAVAEAHVLGIVHRDLKPSNLYLARRPGGRRIVKVVDFGISKQMSTEALPVFEEGAKTRTSAWLGSPLYMSPEQMRSAKDVDARADLWSLGLILYELCTGHVPFDAPSLVELCGRVLHDAATPLERWLADPPPALAKTIERCLKKDREERYRDVAELAADLAKMGSPGAAEHAQRIASVVRGAGSPTSSVTPPPNDSGNEPVLLLRPAEPIARHDPGSQGRRDAATPAELALAPEPARSGRASEPVVARTLARTSASAPDLAPPEERRRGSAGWIVLLLLIVAAGTTAFVRQRAGEWPFAARSVPLVRETPVEPSVAVVPPPPVGVAPASSSSAATAPPPAIPTFPVASSSALVDATRTPPVPALPDAGIRRIAPRGTPNAAIADGPRDSPPVPPAPPARPEVLSETCTQTMPDGTRRTIPCP